MRKILFLLIAMTAAMAAWTADDEGDTAALISEDADYVNPVAEKAAMITRLKQVFVSSRLEEIMDDHGIKCAVVSSASVIACTAYHRAMRRRNPQPRSQARRMGEAMRSQEVRLRRPKIYCNAYI